MIAPALEQYDAAMSERISALIHYAADNLAARGKSLEEIRDILNELAGALWTAALEQRKEMAVALVSYDRGKALH